MPPAKLIDLKRDTIPIPGFVDFHVTEFVLCLDNMSLSS